MLFYLVYSSFMFELRSFSVFACLGFLSPANRGALMTCSLVSSLLFLFAALFVKWYSFMISLNKGMVLLFQLGMVCLPWVSCWLCVC